VNLGFLLARLRDCPLIVSVQASPHSPLDHPDTLLRLAKASLKQGVKCVRIEGVKNLRVMQPEMKVPVIGLLKREYGNNPVYITPTAQDADAIIALGCQIIAIDGTQRPRPGKDDLAAIIAHIHKRKRLVMADCDTLENAIYAASVGADIIGTTLAGYTDESGRTPGPDIDLVRQIAAAVSVPVIAEGRYTERWQVEAALRAGATAVTIGGAINDPVKQTRALLPGNTKPMRVGAVDIGGTNIRFGVFDDGIVVEESVRRAPNPPTREERIAWIRSCIQESGVERVGVGTGGIVDPRTGEVWTAKEYLMPDHIGIRFDEATLGVPTFAHGDGHATAWGHANLPRFAGRRVATLAVGTGLGAGFVADHRIWCGRRGEYPRINDLPAPGGKTYEELLGGIHISATPSEEAQEAGRQALRGAVQAIRDLYFPDDIVIAGSVGLSDWLREETQKLELVPSPFGTDAGLYGAAALARFPQG